MTVSSWTTATTTAAAQTVGPPPTLPRGSFFQAGAGVCFWGKVGLLAIVLTWCYWTTLTTLMERWSNEAQYSHGFLVPIFSLVILAMRRPRQVPPWQASWLGIPVVLSAIGLRWAAAEVDLQALDGASLLVMLFGVTLLVAGRQTLAWSWPALAFLGFMLPLPFAMEVALSHPLQRVATIASTYTLQTLGYPALAEGNVIVLEQMRLGVVEACSGLGMLMTFFALSTAMALVVQAPWPDRIVLIVSAIPIAIVANVLRITTTGMAYYHLGVDSTLAKAIMHDLAGWLMMPLALALLWLELCYLSRLLVPMPR
ncbi:MAG: exosortase/archaeosortase family protein [Gemmataceae bacterium]|nr:exosortase/archaeosortase family protein [Gemmataceae bacterium]